MGKEKGTAGQTQNNENNKTTKGNTAERGGKGGSNTKTQRTHRVSPSTKVSLFLGALFVPLGLWGLGEFVFFFDVLSVFFGPWLGKYSTRNGNPTDRSGGTLPNENASKTSLSLNKTNAIFL